jgi:hypothetical protein
MVPEDLLFWIAAIDGDVDRDVAVLCRRHADAMVVPRGWTLDDRRESTLRLFRPGPAGDDTGAIARRRRRSDQTPPGGIALELDFGDPAAEQPAVPEAAPDPEPWRPAFDVEDDLDGLLQVDSPLLARAFRGTGRRRA